ncbi:MAG: hypothetical protein ABSF26_16710 [Thermoguttaceae bacterium]|jgi:hypothetical protein
MVALLQLGLAGMLAAQEAGAHFWHNGVMPPGAIGARQLQRGGPLPGFFQPVEIKAPAGVLISLAAGNQFDAGQPAPRRAGLLIGSVYRLRVTRIPRAEGLEVFPTVEVIDRLYAPADQQVRFAIPVELTQEDLLMALDGKFVTRVIYLEDQRNALPVRNPAEAGQSQTWFDVGPGRDVLAVADGLGRPVAILRLGARVPDQGSDPGFFFGAPAWVGFSPRPVVVQPAAPLARPAPAVAPPAEVVPAPNAAPPGPQP